jgi:hypothetical protein
MKHTPAPWWRDDDGFIAAGNGETYVTIADADCSSDMDADEREENKKLIIASPDMYKQLRLAEIELAGWMELEEVPAHIAREMRERWTAIRSVTSMVLAAGE